MMTEGEMVESFISAYAMGIGALTLYTTILSGYLVTAYVAGLKMTRLQTLTVSVLFVTTALFASWGTIGFLYGGRILHELQSTVPLLTSRVAPFQIIGVIQVLGIFASLKFMWDVRHPKTT